MAYRLDENASPENELQKTPFAIVIDEVSDKESKLADSTAYVSQFQHRVKKAVIDVYWLFDDGGIEMK